MVMFSWEVESPWGRVWCNDGDARGLARLLIVLTESGCHVHRARALLGVDEVLAEDLEGVLVTLEEPEQRLVASTDDSKTRSNVVRRITAYCSR